MTNKERREIIERAKASGYAGDYVELFRTGAAKLAITEEEREKGLRPYHEAGDTGQTMAFPNTPPNTPFNTIGMKAPIRVTKYVGGKVVKDQVVPPGVSSFNTGSGYGTVVEAPELRARAQQGGRPDFDESGLPIAYAEAIDLEDYMAKNRGNTREFWRATADTIAYHENAIPMTGSMSLTRPQIGGGPGTGLFQFESKKGDEDKDAFETAKQRYVNVVSEGLPGFVPDPQIVNAGSAAELSKDQQYTLFHANMIEGPAKLADYASGKMSIEDLWLKGHKGVEKAGDRASFQESRRAAKKDDLKKYGLRFGGVRYNKGGYKR